ncbi:hypothetical protein [Roseateles flavus]|uniref:Calcineurin-like phosphoesterase domain-containing protein n=1 Tax=Roseateles flavus TaxID=3149041 RepID=A0ABV0G920_9BURK
MENELLEKAFRIHQRLCNLEKDESAKGAGGKPPQANSNVAGHAAGFMVAEDGSSYEELGFLIDRGASPRLVHLGDLTVQGDITGKWLAKISRSLGCKKPVHDLIVVGNLKVLGDLIDDVGLGLSVSGDVACNFLDSGRGHKEVLGNLTSIFGILGRGNDGMLKVGGVVNAPYIVVDDQQMPRTAQCEYIYIEGAEGFEAESVGIGRSTGAKHGWGWHYYDDPQSYLKPEVLSEEDGFDPYGFFDLVKSGLNPFLPPSR